MNIKYQFEQSLKILQKEIVTLESHLSKLPKENIYCKKNGKYVTWIKIDKNTKKRSYIKKKNRVYAELLTLNKYYILQLSRTKEELDLLKDFLARYNNIKIDSSRLFDSRSPYSSLLRSRLNSFSDEISIWVNNSYEQNMHYPESLIHKTLKGDFVRSKSEAIIANTLFLNKIPYKYEAPLCIEDITFYPDFTILHPQTLNIIYWEHFGLMDKLHYRENAFNKLKIYGNNNIFPSINLITTYETKQHPLDSTKINRLIQDMFLN